MSRENVEIVRAAFDAWNAGDMDVLRGYLHPEVIVRSIEGWPEPGPYVGKDAVMRQWGQQRETFDADSFEFVGDLIDAGDRVAVRFIWHGIGSGPEANMEMTYIGMVRDGRIFYVEFFWDHAEALAILGLSD
jgi:ketosteroid isomerase-like protein